MNDIFWLREHKIAGSAGPNRVFWDIRNLKKLNIHTILSVNDGALIRKDELKALSINYTCVPLSKDAPPQPGDIELCVAALPNALKFIVSVSNKKGASLVHCSSGKDRTGMFLCYYLCMVEGYSPEDAIAEVKRVRPIALSAHGWEELTYAVLDRMGI